jgi:raffinose/stachyose/melibiose transport system substrate-binding protein
MFQKEEDKGEVLKMQRKYIYAIVAIVIIVIAAISAIYVYENHGKSTSTSSNITLTFWLPFAGEPWEDEFWGNATQAFYNQYNVTVQVSEYSGDNYFTKLATALGSGAPPDFFVTYGGADATTYVVDNSVANISNLYSQTWAENQIPAAATATESVNGSQYAIPYELDSDWLFINQALFNEYNLTIPNMTAGWTWDQFQADCNVFKQNGIVPVAMSGANTWALTFPEEYILERTNGPDAFANALARETNFTTIYNATDTNIKQWVADNDFQQGWQSADYAADALPLFQNGLAAMWIQGTWGVGMTYDDANFTLGAAPWPYYANNPSANGYIFGEYTSFAVANATKHFAQAEQFLTFISQPYWLSEYVNLTENPVAQVLSSSYPAAYPPTLQAIENAISTAEANGKPLLTRPGTLAPDALSYELDTQNLLVFTGQMTPSAAATTIEATATDIIGPVT